MTPGLTVPYIAPWLSDADRRRIEARKAIIVLSCSESLTVFDDGDETWVELNVPVREPQIGWSYRTYVRRGPIKRGVRALLYESRHDADAVIATLAARGVEL